MSKGSFVLLSRNTNLISTDSAFVSGTKHIYNSGSISDAAINPGDFAEFYVVINIDTDKEIKYFPRDVRWEYFE